MELSAGELMSVAGAALPTRLSAIDLWIVAAYLVGITLFGLRFRERGAKDRSLRSYFLAGNTIPWWAISLSIVSAETSTLTIISIPGVAFAGDLGFLQVVMGYMVGRVVVALLFLPRYFEGEMLTAYQLIEQRFGRVLYKVTAGLFLLTRAAAEGVRVFAVSIVVGIAIGTGDVLSIGIISALTLLYTFEGGMAAVIWTDVVQMGIYVAGTAVAMGTLGAHVPGGWAAIHTAGVAAGKLRVLDFAWGLGKAYTFWAGVLGGTFLTMASHGTDQLMVQRMLAARNLRESRLALLSSGAVIFLQFTLFLLIGVGLWVFYGQHPQAFASGDRIFPSFIVQQMPRGVAGLLVAAILAAAMSNLSAALNSLSSTTVVDFWMGWRPGTGDRERGLVSRGSTAVWAVVLFGIAVYSVGVGGKGHVVEIGLSIASVAYGAMLGVFLLGTLNRRSTEWGAILGMGTGFSLNVLMFLHPLPLRLGVVTIPHVAFTWYVLIGSGVTFLVGSLASLVVGRQRRAVVTDVVLMLLLFGGGGVSLGHADVGPPAPGPVNSPAFAGVDQLIVDAIVAKKLPGAVLLVGHAGKVAYEQAYGDRTVEPRVEPMTVDTIFDMASLTKCLVTATAVMQLWEQGKVGLDDPVATYLPEFGVNGKEKVTVRELLTHTSGLPADVLLADKWNGKEEGIRRAMVSGLETAPGTVFKYSDVNFITLGVLVERVSGEGLETYAAGHIFGPLGMAETRYLPPAAWVPRIAPTAHNDDKPMDDDRLLRGEVHDPTTRRMGGVAGHAGVFSTAHDTGLFAQALLDRLAGRPSKFPLKQATLEVMTTPEQPGHSPADLAQPGPVGVYPSRKGHEVRGLGWDIDSSFSRPRGEVFPVGSFGHTGFTGTSLWMDPGSDTYVVLLANSIHPRGRPPISHLRGDVATAVGRALELYPSKCPDHTICGPAISADHGASEVGKPAHAGTGIVHGPSADGTEPTAVLTGVDVLEKTKFAVLKEMTARHGGRLRLGLLTNQTGVDRAGRRTIDMLADNARKSVPGLELAVLFSPEHGIAGAKDSTDVANSVDAATKLPVISLYGAKDADRRPKTVDLAKLDAVVIDLQDMGVRFYTYETVTGYFVEACAKAGVDLVVLDRPASIGGSAVEGPISDAGLESYTDYMPMPVRNGMTVGELARYFNGEKKLGAKLAVVPMEGWRRADFFNDTGLPWINPSPNLRSQMAAVLYPGVGMVEQTNISVGRGTETPFEVIGAPWIKGSELEGFLEGRRIPGMLFEKAKFAVAEDGNRYPFHGQTIEGVRLTCTDRTILNSPELGVELLTALRHLYPTQFQVAKAKTLVANAATMEELERGNDPRRIADGWRPGLEAFRARRARYLLYP